MSARVTLPRRSTLSAQLDPVASASPASDDATLAAIADADAVAAEILAEQRVQPPRERRTTGLGAALALPQRSAARQGPIEQRRSFFNNSIAPYLTALGEQIAHVAQRCDCEAALVERAAAQLTEEGVPVHISSLTSRTKRLRLIASVAQRIHAEPALVERAAADLESNEEPLTAFWLESRSQWLRYSQHCADQNARRREMMAEAGSYGLEQMDEPTEQDHTPAAARERLRRDSEIHGWILRPQR